MSGVIVMVPLDFSQRQSPQPQPLAALPGKKQGCSFLSSAPGSQVPFWGDKIKYVMAPYLCMRSNGSWVSAT